MNASTVRNLHEGAIALAAAAAAFALFALVALAQTRSSGAVTTLVHSEAITALHKALQLDPKNENLKQEIRVLDARERHRLFAELARSQAAAKALLGGAIVFFAAAHTARRLRRRLPDPRAWPPRQAGAEAAVLRRARVGLLLCFGIVAGAGASLALAPARLPPPDLPAPEAIAESPYPTLDAVLANWPTFRGPRGAARPRDAAQAGGWPQATGLRVRWQADVPLQGAGSPVVWDNRIYLGGANGAEQRVFCYALDTGHLLWSALVTVPAGPRGAAPEVYADTGHAASTLAVDGRRVYAIFANGNVAAFDPQGRQVWARNVGPFDNTYGHASSLALWQDRLLLQLDQAHASDGLSRLLALDTRTGLDAWSVPRAVDASWASPVLLPEAEPPAVLLAAAPLLTAYHPATGALLWSAPGIEGEVAATPLVTGDRVIVINPGAGVLAYRASGDAARLWLNEDTAPDTTSAAADDTRVFGLDSGGRLTCHDLDDGNILWEYEAEDDFYASPAVIGDRLLLLSRKGVASLLRAGDSAAEALATVKLDDTCVASPAFAAGLALVRGDKRLYALEPLGPDAAAAAEVEAAPPATEPLAQGDAP